MSALMSNSECHPATTTLVALMESLQGMDYKLGYRGRERFVIFYHEPRGQEMFWRDGHSHGSATGAGQLFIDELAPVAEFHNVDVGTNRSTGTHVLLIDGGYRRAYFVERDEAIRFLASVAGKRGGDSGTPHEVPALASLQSLVEITQESIRNLL